MLQAPALQVPSLRFDNEQVSAGSYYAPQSLGEDAGNSGLQGGQSQFQVQPLMGVPQSQFGMDNGMGFVFYPENIPEPTEPAACVEEPTEPEAGAKKTRDAKVKKGKKEKGMLCC